MIKQKLSAYLGCFVLVVHTGMTIYLWVVYQAQTSSQVAVAQISLPITLAYAVTVVKWLVDTQGKITRRAKVGWPYVFGVAVTVGGFFGALGFGLHSHLAGNMGYQALNAYFAFIDGSLGALVVLFFNDLFATNA
jgi:hypothetical protein